MAAVCASPAFNDRSVAQAQISNLRVDADRRRQSLEALSLYGRSAGGTFADGVSRIAYSEADEAGRKYAMDLMRAAGLEPRVDTGGNIFSPTMPARRRCLSGATRCSPPRS